MATKPKKPAAKSKPKKAPIKKPAPKKAAVKPAAVKKPIPKKAIKKETPKAKPAPVKKESPAPKKDVKNFTVAIPVADLLANPDNEVAISPNDSQLLFGETFKVEGRKNGWLYGISAVDGYAGYVRESDLKPEKEKATHIIDRPQTRIYPSPDFKTRPVMTLGFMARVHIESGVPKNDFLKIPGRGWTYRTHIKKIDALKQNMDPLTAALKFLGAPYLYGGRSFAGIDCSGLVQLALSYCDIPCPRDSAEQINLGRGVTLEEMRRGDLVFFRGHVGFLIDRMHVLNATARTMDVRIERLEDLASVYGGVIAVRRLG